MPKNGDELCTLNIYIFLIFQVTIYTKNVSKNFEVFSMSPERELVETTF